MEEFHGFDKKDLIEDSNSNEYVRVERVAFLHAAITATVVMSEQLCSAPPGSALG